MRKFAVLKIALVIAGAFLFLAGPARAQSFTSVTGTVVDPNGIPYGNGTMSAVLTPGSPGGWTLNGQPYSGRVGPVTLDSNGSFTANFGSNAVILPAGTQWLITVNSNPGGILPPLGTGAQTFSVTISISGASQNISSTLNAAAPKLTNFISPGGGLVSCTTTGGVYYQNGTPNVGTCSPLLTFDGTTFTDSASTPGTTTSHFGDPDSSVADFNGYIGILPGRNEIIATGGESDGLDALAVVGYKGPYAAVQAGNYNNQAGPYNLYTFSANSVYDGAVTGEPVAGYWDQSQAINGSNITGDGVESGFVTSARFEPHVNAENLAGGAGSASHADFLYGVYSRPILGNANPDNSSVGTMVAFEALNTFDNAGGTNTATNVMGFEAKTAQLLGTQTITNQYGYYAHAISGAANNWGFFSETGNRDKFASIYEAHLLISETAPTILTAGCGGAAAAITINNGTAAFTVNVGTTNTGTCTVTMPTATTDWNCSATDITTTSTLVTYTKAVPGGTPATQLTLQNYTDISGTHAWVDSDKIQVRCMAE